MKPIILFSLPLLFGASFACAGSGAPSLALPVQCEIGQACLVQKLVDHDPGPGRQDDRCGSLTTNGHDGIDIRLRTLADMKAGHRVIAAAAGTVLRTRDGEPDISSRTRTNLDGKDAGNAVILDHGNGWETQYSHLRLGSVSVRAGQRVAAGENLGLIGMSGNAEFPHLHFTLRHLGQAVDPFMAAAPGAPCSPSARARGLWNPAAARALAYVPSAVITAGLSSTVPPRSVADRAVPPVLAGAQAPLLLWVDVIGAKPGDTETFRIAGPDGQIIHLQETRVTGGGLSWFAYSGKRAPPDGWKLGRYMGHYELRRAGEIVAQSEIAGVIR